MSNIKQPASKTAKPQKLLLFPGDPLIKTLKPDYYVIVDPSTLEEIGVSGLANTDDQTTIDEEVAAEEEAFYSGLDAPNLEDITLVSKKMITDDNKNQYVEFVFNIKNHIGDAVVGVHGYGQ
jgi:hypothetical protein